jgi:porphobilinogen synthase
MDLDIPPDSLSLDGSSATAYPKPARLLNPSMVWTSRPFALSYNRPMSFPAIRMRRLRRSEPLRALVRETVLEPGDLIYPLFLCPGEGVRREVSSMPGVFNLSVDEAVREAEDAASLGVGGLLLFGIPESKDETGSGAWEENGIVQRGLRALRQSPAAKQLVLMADVCLCEYTSHGHCGVVAEGRDGFEVDNDPSLDLLARASVSLAQAGADVVAPSDMMDGRVAAIRALLDENGKANTPIVAYAAKYASAFYGPFREAAESAPAFGDRRSYQMDPANAREALREVLLDVEEGADLVMVKPAGPYLDIIRQVRDAVRVPVVAYQVSGEFSLIRAAAERGWIDERAAVLETLTGIRRAGADLIISYFAPEVVRWLSS